MSLPPQPHRVASQPAAEFSYSPTLPKDPELRKQKLEDLIDQIKGTYNFMQVKRDLEVVLMILRGTSHMVE